MIVAIDDLRKKINQLLIKNGFNENDSANLADIVVEQELVGNQFSSIAELGSKHSKKLAEESNIGAEIVVDKPAMMLVKGNGRSAPLITADYLDVVIDKAKSQGIYAMGIYDSTYNDFFDVYCRRAAEKDCIAIIFENGGPQGVVPFGGKSDVTGTNPLAYGIPTNKYPIVFDAATAMHAYGRIRQAKELGEKLPENAYVDEAGNITTDPNEAYAVLPFGGFKGFGINLLVDVLSGCLVRGKSGLDMPEDSQRYIGTLILVISPEAFGDIDEFKKSTTKLADDILAVEAIDPSSPVRVPGFKGSKRKEDALKNGNIELDDIAWQKFESSLSS